MGALDILLRDLILMNAIDLTRLEAAEKAKVLEILKRLEKDLAALLLSDALSGMGKVAINAILLDARSAIKDAYSVAHVTSLKTLSGLGEVEAKATAKAVGNVLNITIGPDSLPAQGYLDKLAANTLIDGSPSKEWWSRQAGDVAFRFSAELRKGLAAGETNQQIVARIVGKDGQPGVMPIARRNAATLVQTSVQAVASAARKETFSQFDDVIKGTRFLATLDSHTCEMCAVRDGLTWDLEGNGLDGNDLPYQETPLHMNCRCAETAVLKTFAEQGIDLPELPDNRTRASTNGPVSSKLTFADWFKGRSVAEQNEQFGKGKAELYRQGKISMRDMLDQSGNPLTLEQLQAKHK
ncbi:phage minor head protein [Undibacterium sp. TJN19]|uniref:phage minor head protein n=1 Tax=Undibacterium sp. TJN19 TaxID=3413055 RepID=UPI003BF0A46E